MQITQAELDRYRLKLARQQSDARAYIIARLEFEPGISEMSVAEVRDKTIEIMQDCLGVYGDQAQALSAELFDEISEAEGLGADPARIFDGLIDDGMMEEKVRYYARALAGEEPDWEGYEGSSADLAAYYVHRSAMQNIARNCERNGIRYARVATGRDSCGFCFMLSSRGFVYSSEGTAEASSHPHCDCIVVPGKKGVTHIEGYDPDAMRDRWKSCYDTIGGREQLSADWDSLSKKEKARYKGKSEALMRDDYIRKRIQAECETRSPEWLYRGEAASVTWEKSREEFLATAGGRRELKVIDTLTKNGFPLVARAEDAPSGYSNIDLLHGEDLWEIKAPDGATTDGLRFVEKNLRKAKRQFKKWYPAAGENASTVRVVFSNQFRKENDTAVVNRIRTEMERHGIGKVLYIASDGSITRINPLVRV